jgi:hypothetical protein
MIVTSQVITCTFDKKLNTVTIQEKNLIGENKHQYSNNEITDIKIEKAKYNSKASRIILWQTSGKEIPLTWFYHYSSVEDNHKIVTIIRNFLNL